MVLKEQLSWELNKIKCKITHEKGKFLKFFYFIISFISKHIWTSHKQLNKHVSVCISTFSRNNHTELPLTPCPLQYLLIARWGRQNELNFHIVSVQSKHSTKTHRVHSMCASECWTVIRHRQRQEDTMTDDQTDRHRSREMNKNEPRTPTTM